MGNRQPFVISPCKLALFFKQMHFTSASNELWSDLKYIEDNISFFWFLILLITVFQVQLHALAV